MFLEQQIDGRKRRREIRAMVDMFEEVTKDGAESALSQQGDVI